MVTIGISGGGAAPVRGNFRKRGVKRDQVAMKN